MSKAQSALRRTVEQLGIWASCGTLLCWVNNSKYLALITSFAYIFIKSNRSANIKPATIKFYILPSCTNKTTQEWPTVSDICCSFSICFSFSKQNTPWVKSHICGHWLQQCQDFRGFFYFVFTEQHFHICNIYLFLYFPLSYACPYCTKWLYSREDSHPLYAKTTVFSVSLNTSTFTCCFTVAIQKKTGFDSEFFITTYARPYPQKPKFRMHISTKS